VSKAGGPNTAGTLREALARAGEGWTVVIAEPRLSEPALRLDGARRRLKDLTIESGTPDGRPAVIEYAGARGGVMLDALGVEGLRVRNVEFDGKGSAEVGVQVGGIAPGTALEGVTVRNVQKDGFKLWNVAGSADRPLVLERVRVVLAASNEAGVLSLATGQLDNKHIAVKGGRFEGAGGGSGVRVEGPAHAVELTNNRFFNLGAAVSFHRPAGQLRFANNTVSQAQVGLLFDVPPPPPPPKPPAPNPPPSPIPYDLKVSLNYFARTPELLRCPVPIQGLDAEHNLYAPDSGLGGLPPNGATKLDAPTLPNPDPADDAHFLRFPNGGPTAGPNKARVGAQ
jgi:hypothetical protein